MEAEGTKPFVCIGTAIVDCIVRGIRTDAASGQGFTAEMTELAPGGEALNQAAALSGLGEAARLVCFAGKDAAGELLLQKLKTYPIDLRYVVRPDKVPTPVSVLFINEKGERKSVTSGAHYFNFHPEEDMSFLEDAEGIVLGALFRTPFDDPDTVKLITSEAKKRGIPVYADTKLPKSAGQTLENYREALNGMDCIFPNEKEAAWYTGKTEIEDMAEIFLQYGVKRVVIKRGENGCYYRNSSESVSLAGIRVAAVDTTGAGDNFIAGFLAMCREGGTAEEALRFANVCGALSTTAFGASAAGYGRAGAEKKYRETYGES